MLTNKNLEIARGKIKMPIAYKGMYGMWRIINIVVLGLITFGFLFTCYFIYENIFSAISNANAIVALKSNISYDLDIEAYEKAINAITQKKRTEGFPAKIRNIFSYNINTSTYANTSTKP